MGRFSFLDKFGPVRSFQRANGAVLFQNGLLKKWRSPFRVSKLKSTSTLSTTSISDPSFSVPMIPKKNPLGSRIFQNPYISQNSVPLLISNGHGFSVLFDIFASSHSRVSHGPCCSPKISLRCTRPTFIRNRPEAHEFRNNSLAT